MDKQKMKQFLYQYNHLTGTDKIKCKIAQSKSWSEMMDLLLNY